MDDYYLGAKPNQLDVVVSSNPNTNNTKILASTACVYEAIQQLLTEIDNRGTHSIGEIFTIVGANSTYMPLGAVPCNGNTFPRAMYTVLYDSYLNTGKFETCTFEEFTNTLNSSGECSKWGIDTATKSFRVPKINSTQGNVYVQLTTGTLTEIPINWNNFQSALNLKQTIGNYAFTKEATSVSVPSVIISSVYDNTLNTWYNKFSNGFIIQGGTIANASEYTTGTIQLPVAFTNANYVVNITSTNNGSSYTPVISAKTVNSFTYFNVVSKIYKATWLAMGY